VQAEHEAQLAKLAAEHQTAISAARELHQQDLDSIRAKHASELERVTTSLEEQVWYCCWCWCWCWCCWCWCCCGCSRAVSGDTWWYCRSLSGTVAQRTALSARVEALTEERATLASQKFEVEVRTHLPFHSTLVSDLFFFSCARHGVTVHVPRPLQRAGSNEERPGRRTCSCRVHGG